MAGFLYAKVFGLASHIIARTSEKTRHRQERDEHLDEAIDERDSDGDRDTDTEKTKERVVRPLFDPDTVHADRQAGDDTREENDRPDLNERNR